MNTHLFDLDFDIDVELAGCSPQASAVLLDSRWYTLTRARPGRDAKLQNKLDEMFAAAMRQAQWQAAQARHERRRAVRVPILSRVHAAKSEAMTACDISLAGLRCSGRPKKDTFDIEFKVPGLAFPVDARARVRSFRDSNVIPLVGLEFVDIDPPYLGYIQSYIDRRCLAA